jgi:predicted DNA-binding protein (MmcQ/YjbR family)
MNKKHWNTIYFDGSVGRELIFELIDHSYDLVVNGLTRKLKSRL